MKFFRNFVANNLKRLYGNYMEQYISQDEIRRIIITDMVKKRGSIVPVIRVDTNVSYSFGVPLVLLWLSDEPLTWICSAFEEGSKFMWRYALLIVFMNQVSC